MYFYCSKQTELTSVEHEEVEVSTNIIKPSGVITAKEGISLDTNFNTRHSLLSKDIVKRPDNRSSWYSLDDMQNFLNLIMEENPNVNGVRFYLGVETTKEDPKGLTTIFMVSTQDDGDCKNTDIPEAKGMDRGETGDPPEAGYPQ